MSRYILPILLCLFLGCVTSIAVAWGCAYFLDAKPSDWDFPSVEEEVILWDLRVRQGKGYYAIICGRCTYTEEYREIKRKMLGEREALASALAQQGRQLPPREKREIISPDQLTKYIPAWVPDLANLPLNSSLRDYTNTLILDARGWPCVSMVCQQVLTPKGVSSHVLAGIELEDTLNSWNLPYALPLRPIWSGLLINTLFYGAIWVVIFLGLLSTRRAIRKKLGICPKCAYNLLGELQKGCPECGWRRT